ncbi:unnamed protein product [Adineta ricciae]|uniref:Homeobox domain-containing protein n=1 Tax=Adineta ricciae TaxID=249248 RepID=A0A814S6U0_ADIRI|nr:unnamed protein product [Adineta ricciae]
MFGVSVSSMHGSPNGKSMQSQTLKRSHPHSPKRIVKKCAFDIESLLKPTNNSSYIDDTEDGSSDDGHGQFESSFCTSSPILSYALFNQLKTNENFALSSSFESEHCTMQKKCKRIRTIFTSEQLERLEAEFEKQQYMVGNERSYLAKKLDLSEAQIKIWFQNRRIKWRRQTMDNHQQ